MDELTYNILIRTKQGLTLLGKFGFRVLVNQPADRTADGIGELLTPTQQQATTELFVYPMEGSISIPLLTGLQPVPLVGTAWFPLIGPYLTAILGEVAPRYGLVMQLYELDNEHVCGGLQWRAGEPGELTFSLLATSIQPPA